jgi:hypothetical protein
MKSEGANRSASAVRQYRLRRGIARELRKAARDTAEDVTATVAW